MSAQLPIFTYSQLVGLPSEAIVSKLSFSHLVELLPVEDSLKRAFYRVECIKGNWSIREFKRQMQTGHILVPRRAAFLGQ